MPKHDYVYTRSPSEGREQAEAHARNIARMSRAEAIAHLQRLNVELNETFIKFNKLISKKNDANIEKTYLEMVQKGLYWQSFAQRNKINAVTIEAVSKFNQHKLMKKLNRMNPKYRPLLEYLVAFPWTLKHNTKPKYIKVIKESRRLMSLTELQRRNLDQEYQGGTTAGGLDDKLIHNEDFVFFRLSAGTSAAHSRFGSECLVFKSDQLFKRGWVTLFDMLSPSSTERMAVLPHFDDLNDFNAKRTAFGNVIRAVSNTPDGLTISYPNNRNATQQLHRAEIVFYGDDIRICIACSVLIELMNMGGEKMLDMALKYTGQADKFLNLITNLFWIEAKMPRSFTWENHELLAEHSNVPYDASNRV